MFSQTFAYGENKFLCSNTRRYRFGFNGQEKDDEITGQTGSHLNAPGWEYDSRIARRWNIDPRYSEYPSQSPYMAFNGNPIIYSDPTGEGGEVSNVQANTDPNTGKTTYTCDLTMNIFLYTDRDNVNLNSYQNSTNTSVDNYIKNKDRYVRVANPDGSGRTVRAKANVVVNVQVISSYTQAANDISRNKSTKNNYVYVDDDMSNLGEYANGNSAWFGGGVTQKNIAHAIGHLLDYRPFAGSEVGEHSQDPNDVMYGRDTPQNATSPLTDSDWDGINNQQPITNRRAPGKNSGPFGGYLNNILYGKKDKFENADQHPQSTPRN